MRRLLAGVCAGVIAGFLATERVEAQVQNAVVVATCGSVTYTAGQPAPLTIDVHGNQCNNGTGGGGGSVTQGTTPWVTSLTAFSAGFRPTAFGTPITATTGGVTGTLPAGAEVIATNVGTTNGAYCQLGASVTSSAQYIAPNGGWFAFGISGDTQLTCQSVASTTTINMAGGSGLPGGTGGGGGGGGVAQGSTTSGQTGTLIQGAVTTAAPTYVNGQTSPFSLDTAGNLRVNLVTGGGGAKITVNAPPNDVLLGPTTISSPADQTVNSQGSGSVGLQITGTCTSLSGLVRASVDGTNYFNVPSFNSAGGTAVLPGTAITGTGSWFIPAAGYPNIQFHPTALTASCTFTLNASAGSIQPFIATSGGQGVDILGVNNGTVSTGTGSADTHTMRVAAAFQTTTSTNGSTTITAGGSYQTLLASNTSRRGCLIQNPATATETLFVNVGGADTNATSYTVSPGFAFNCWTGNFTISDKIDVSAATTGHAFVATNQ